MISSSHTTGDTNQEKSQAVTVTAAGAGLKSVNNETQNVVAAAARQDETSSKATDEGTSAATGRFSTLLQQIGIPWQLKRRSTAQKALTNSSGNTNEESSLQQHSSSLGEVAGPPSSNDGTHEVTPSEADQLKSPPLDNSETIAMGASEDDQQSLKEAAKIDADKVHVAEDFPGNKPDGDVSKSAPMPGTIDDDRATGDGTLLQVVTDGSETETPQRTADVVMLDVDKLACKKKSEDDGNKMPVEEVRGLGQATKTEDQESGNGDHHLEGEFVPRAVYVRDLAREKRKYGKYKKKTLLNQEKIDKLEREVKRLRVELHRVRLGAQLRAPGETGENSF
jgi:hypothetical protein